MTDLSTLRERANRSYELGMLFSKIAIVLAVIAIISAAISIFGMCT